MSQKAKKILLVFPKSGVYDRYVVDLPLSVLCAGRICIQNGYDVAVMDQRFEEDWKGVIDRELVNGLLLVGLSVMTGTPIKYALEISRYVKQRSDVPVVWGGIHPSILPELTLADESVDILIKGPGEYGLYELAISLDTGAIPLEQVSGISFKHNGQQVHKHKKPLTDPNDLPEIPYELVNVWQYSRFGGSDRSFSIITSFGCPHQCTFCYSPAYHKGEKWLAYDALKTVEHIEKVLFTYSPTSISVIDSDFFVNMKRVTGIFEEIVRRGLKTHYIFRGTRVDEMVRIPEETLELMNNAGKILLFIGAESGSQRVLNLMQKGRGCTAENTIMTNRRLSKFLAITPSYNFFSGIPTETVEDYKKSVDLMLQLLDENPCAQITGMNQFVPYPGTELFDMAVEYGFKPPMKLEEWIDYDTESCSKHLTWLTKREKKVLNMLNFACNFIDSKLEQSFTANNLESLFWRWGSRAYRPIARFRAKNLITAFPLEMKIKEFLVNDSVSV